MTIGARMNAMRQGMTISSTSIKLMSPNSTTKLAASADRMVMCSTSADVPVEILTGICLRMDRKVLEISPMATPMIPANAPPLAMIERSAGLNPIVRPTLGWIWFRILHRWRRTRHRPTRLIILHAHGGDGITAQQPAEFRADKRILLSSR